jgi:hypothetical protein
MGCAEVISLTELGPNPTLTLVANSLWNAQEDLGTAGARRLR